jgi:tetratricopeptide (TPR) repeat protein
MKLGACHHRSAFCILVSPAVFVVISLAMTGLAAEEAPVEVMTLDEKMREASESCRGTDPVECLTSLLSNDPQSDLLFACRSVYLEERGEHAQAMRDISMAISINPSQPGYYALRSRFRASLGDTDGAEQDMLHKRNLADPYLRELDERLAAHPDDLNALLRRSSARYTRTDYAGALEDLEAYVMAARDDVDPYQYLRLYSLRSIAKDFTGAERALTTGIETARDWGMRALLLHRRASLRRDVLADNAGAAADDAERQRIIDEHKNATR